MKLSPHIGKIGRLPYELRCQVARGIQNRVPGIRLVAWLNSRPEVQAILDRDFGGKEPQPMENPRSSRLASGTGFRPGRDGYHLQTDRTNGGFAALLQPHEPSSNQS